MLAASGAMQGEFLNLIHFLGDEQRITISTYRPVDARRHFALSVLVALPC